MYNVLLVDDEMLIRTNLKVMLDWEKSGFSLCGEAVNGLEALNIIKTLKPDIVITDVKMPVMDGLQLSTEMKIRYPYIKIIILSNYDDFEYVKKSLKIGVVDYILKHNLNEEALLDALNRAKTAIDEYSKNKNESALFERTTTNNLLALKEKFIIQLLTGFYKNEDEIIEHLQILDININTKSVMLIEMVIDDYKLAIDKGDLRDISLLEFSIVNITEEILNNMGNGTISHIANEKFVILLSMTKYRSSNQIDNIINNLLSRIAQCMKEFINISVSFSIGSLCSSITSIQESYKHAEEQLKRKFFLGKNCIMKGYKETGETDLFIGLSIETEKEIITYIKLRKPDKLFTLLEKNFERIKTENLGFTNSQMIFSDLLGIINKTCKENGIQLSSIYSSDSRPYELILKFETLKDIKDWIFSLYGRLFTALDSDNNSLNSEYVKKAINFIKSHYAENISLSYVANQINISDKYLSMLFKEEMGKGFIEYLIQLRLEKAKALLEEGKTDIRRIVDLCGFSDYAYFFKIFKKKIGVTPKEYINDFYK